MAEAKFTTDHDEIREWAEARGGRTAAAADVTARGLSPSAMSRDDENGVAAADRQSSVVCTGSYRRSQPNDPVRAFSCVAPRISWHRPGGRCGRRAGGICPVQDLP